MTSWQERIGQKLLLAFHGLEGNSAQVDIALQQYRPAGFTLFAGMNLSHPAQVRLLTADLQRKAHELGLAPLLIATDQEGGQLMAIGEGVTSLPGNMALGAAGCEDLARQAGEVLGRELAAMGININYAPCCDVNINPANPVIGIRSFGEEPAMVAGMTAAMIAGMQSAGVAAAAKHFPGHGDTAVDSHLGLPVVAHTLERLREVELPPFRAAVDGGVKLVMSAHLALPAVDGPDAPPATLSHRLLTGLLREELGFEGLIVSDAMDMRAIQQGEGLGADALRAVLAGIDLLLMGADPQDHAAVFHALMKADLDEGKLRASLERIAALKQWLLKQPPQPALEAAGCAAHRAVAERIARRSITLVRDEAGLLPLRLASDQQVAVVLPRPVNLTPADTSGAVTPALGEAMRRYHPRVEEFIIPWLPEEGEIAAMRQRLKEFDLVVIGTINAFEVPGQAALVHQLLREGIPTVVAALRLPYDLKAFPEAPVYLCTYGVREPSIEALAAALFGQAELTGRLPVAIPGLYAPGHRWQLV